MCGVSILTGVAWAGCVVFWVARALGVAVGMDDDVSVNCAKRVVGVRDNTKAEESCWSAGGRTGCLAGRVAAETVRLVSLTRYDWLVDWLAGC